jgi:chemotaxis family two-component system sensor kinase Cph1
MLKSEKIVETVLTKLEPLIDDTNATIKYDPLPLIYANEQMMIQLFQNLIGNALKYHRELLRYKYQLLKRTMNIFSQ